MTPEYVNSVNAAAQYIQSCIATEITFAILTGTGQGAVTDIFDEYLTIDYKDIPYFPVATVDSHHGLLYIGKVEGRTVLVFSGRFHYYEGHDMLAVTFPVRVIQVLQCKHFIITNAVGSVQPDLPSGSITVIKDHINLHAANPLRGDNYSPWGERFPDMSHAYDLALRKKALAIASSMDLPIRESIYVGTQGPNLETPSEYQYFNIIGGDVVGMSTVPEVIVAAHGKIPTLVCSIVTNQCYPFDQIQPTTIETVIKVANKSTPILFSFLKKLILEHV